MALHTGKFQTEKSGQYGQAMTEMVIAASFVLVPLFLLIPLLGKYIDLNHSTIQAARYEAWEYTVWYNNVATEAPTNAVDKNGSQIAMPEKSIANLQVEARQRFFSREAFSSDPGERDLINEGNWDIADTNPLWQDHIGNSLLANTVTIDSIVMSNEDTPSNATTNNSDFKALLKVDKLVYDAAQSAGSAIANLIAGTSPTFVIDRLKGYSRTQMTVPIISQPGLVSFGTISGNYAQGTTPNTVSFSFTGRAAVLSDGWNAGGRYHVKDQVGEMTIARKLTSLSDKMTGLIPAEMTNTLMIRATGNLGFADMLECGDDRGTAWVDPPSDDNDGSLWTGYVDQNAIHPDRLHVASATNYTANTDHIGGTTGTVPGHDCPDNTCNYTYNNSYTYPWADPAVDDQLSAPDDCIK